MPWFGPMRMNEIMASHVREWVTGLQAKGVSPATIQKVRFILSAIFTTALNDVIYLHPVRGVKPPPVPKKRRVEIVTPEQFDRLYLGRLPSDTMKLLVETDVGGGLRWGELTELQPQGPQLRHRRPDGQPRVGLVELPPRFHPEGGRFLVKDYPKDQEHRQLGAQPADRHEK